MGPRIYDFFIKDYGVWDSIWDYLERFENGKRTKVFDLYFWVEDKGKEVYCAIKGHEWVMDQCGIPGHDYCAWCAKPIPVELMRQQ